jgi:hypothetical protein
MRQQPTFYRLDRSAPGSNGRGGDRPEGGPSMMVPLPPGWLCLQDCNVSGQLNQPVVVPFVLMHPDVGVALIDVSPASNPEAEQILRRRLEAARFDSIFPGFLPVLHLRLDRADLPATEAILRDAFSAMPPLSLPGGDGWISVVRRALLPRDPTRAAAHPGLSGEPARRTQRDAGPPPPHEAGTESDMLHREAVTAHTASKPSYDAESPVPAARATGPLPWIIMSGVGGLIAVLALFSLLGTGGPTPDAADTAGETGNVPAASAPAPPAQQAPFAGTPAPDPSTASSKPPASPAVAPPSLPSVATAPAPPSPPSSAPPPASTTGASALPAPAQRSVPAPPPAGAADRSPRVTVRQPANLRAAPDSQANIVRVVPRGETLRVHGRTANGWVQVGDAEPRGWLHNSRLGDAE